MPVKLRGLMSKQTLAINPRIFLRRCKLLQRYLKLLQNTKKMIFEIQSFWNHCSTFFQESSRFWFFSQFHGFIHHLLNFFSLFFIAKIFNMLVYPKAGLRRTGRSVSTVQEEGQDEDVEPCFKEVWLKFHKLRHFDDLTWPLTNVISRKNEISKRMSIIRAYSIERAWSKSDVLIWNKFIPDWRSVILRSSSMTLNDPEE